MHDIKYIVENIDQVNQALSKRLDQSEYDLDSLVGIYENFKDKKSEYESERAKQKDYNDKMAKLDKSSQEFKDTVEDLKQLSSKVKELEGKFREVEQQLSRELAKLPNLPDEDVPAGGKDNNIELRKWGKEPEFDFEIKDHMEIGENLGILDFGRAAKIGGAQMSMYRGDGARLLWALVNFFMDEHTNSGYEAILPPHLLNENSAFVAGQLPKYKDDVYWTQDDQCLLPTAETALANFYGEEILEEGELPKKLFAYTPCYRREAGSYRKNERGLMRMHQFHKVEMFQFTRAEKSEDALDEITKRAEELVKKLGLRYRVSLLAGEDMAFQAAKTLDVEIWLPFQKMWTEVSSISNARDFQSRRGNIRYRDSNGDLQFVHSLNGSGLATPRLIIGILETYQKSDGSVVIPEVLQKYMGKSKIG